MKKLNMIIAAIVLAVAGLSTAQAQSSWTNNMKANIPFEFSVGDKTMPAGEYIVRCVNPTSSVKVLHIRRTDGSASALVRTNSINRATQDEAKLVFHRYGDQYFFAQAWNAADGIGMQAPRSKAMKALELARRERTTETVALTR